MELRDIEIFLTAAQELHFGRTAERLHVTPARVSQSIRRTERRVGALLFERTTRSVRLTALGEQLQREFDAGYRRIREGIDTTARAASGVRGTLVLGLMGPHRWMMHDAVQVFRDGNPHVQLEFREIQPAAPLDPLRAGAVDVALLWQPVREPDLTVGPVTHLSPVCVMTAATHPYAAREAVGLEDLGEHCAFLPGLSLPPYLEASFQPFHTPAGRPIPRGPMPTTWHESLTLVAAGRGVAGVAAEAARFYPWPGLAFVPVEDAPPVPWALVWRTGEANPHALAFAEVVKAVASAD
ncbi:LysR family transcriptional regulator [Streptomyces sp. NPDC003395]